MNWKRLESLLPKEPGARMLALGLLLAGCLLLCWSFFPQQSTNPSSSSSGEDLESYTAELESRTEILLRQIQGAGAVHVMITLEQGQTTVYQTDDAVREDSTANGDSAYEKETAVVFGESGGDEQALVTANQEPKVRGVAVICEGAGNPAVEAAVLNTVTSLFSINTTQVSVVAGIADP